MMMNRYIVRWCPFLQQSFVFVSGTHSNELCWPWTVLVALFAVLNLRYITINLQDREHDLRRFPQLLMLQRTSWWLRRNYSCLRGGLWTRQPIPSRQLQFFWRRDPKLARSRNCSRKRVICTRNYRCLLEERVSNEKTRFISQLFQRIVTNLSVHSWQVGP